MSFPPPPVSSVLDAIGNTPVVQLKHIVPKDSADVFVKLEYMSPTGSYKDRMARSMIEEAERRLDLTPDMTVVEATGGSTGSSLAFVCAVKGYKFMALSSDAYAKEKLRTMAAFGAAVDITHSPTGKATADLMASMKSRATDLGSNDKYFHTDQFSNCDALVGYAKIGQELLSQFPEGFEVFCGAFGTAGMMMSVSSVIKATNPNIRVVLLEPESAALLAHSRRGSHAVDGIAPGFISTHVDETLQCALVILGAFMINFTTCGVIFSFGVYQEHYETMVLHDDNPFTGASAASIDLIGTLSASLMTISAPFVMAWTKYFRPKYVIWTGGILFGVAGILASFGKALWHFQLAQGMLFGIAAGLSFIPSMTIAPTWFDGQRGVVMGVISAGTGIGGLVWAPATSACISEFGFRNTLRLVASFKLPPFSASYYTPVFFIVLYSKALGYNEKDGANLTALSNACNAIGKVSAGLLGDRLGRLNSYFLTTFITAVIIIGLWLPSTSVGNGNEAMSRQLFIAFTILYGLFASAFISLFPVALVELFGVDMLPRLAGVMYMLQGLGTLVGTPSAAVLISSYNGSVEPSSYTPVAAFVGALMVATTVAVAGIRFGYGIPLICPGAHIGHGAAPQAPFVAVHYAIGFADKAAR
ncbi:monocarboxylate transporter [Colletotrichum karsti]|uniref:Monocarboxylate transporter n=1 Tax=Colletotrichum karsti TaxID=1095194 RepID=A0A9P6I7P0_9PEZI|nr:monocarboxylate transporter [Colletotrichum karsti]KAF9877267.1 monocarboxylate transporter [Colletotrichum karsti]